DNTYFRDHDRSVVPRWVICALYIDQHVALEQGSREVRSQGVQPGPPIAAVHTLAIVRGDVVRIDEASADAFGADHVASLEDRVVVDGEIPRSVLRAVRGARSTGDLEEVSGALPRSPVDVVEQ